MFGAGWLALKNNPSMAGWSFYCPITIPYSLMTFTQSGITFPWILQAAAMPSNLWSNCNTDGGDIRFTSDSAGNNPLHCEIKNFNKTGHIGTFYIGLPSVNSSSDTTIYIWYGNSSATMPIASNTTLGSQGVWDPNYVMVFHCEEAAGANLLDSTSYGNNLTQYNSPNSAPEQIDNGRTFNGANQYFSMASSPDLTQCTVEAWQNLSGSCMLLGQCDIAKNNARQISLYWTGLWKCYTDTTSGSQMERDWNGVSPGHVALADDNVLADFRAYSNGVSQTIGTSGSVTKPLASDSGPFSVGREGNYDGLYANGWEDEIRISNIARSDGWIKTSYNNQSNLSTSGTAGTPIAI